MSDENKNFNLNDILNKVGGKGLIGFVGGAVVSKFLFKNGGILGIIALGAGGFFIEKAMFGAKEVNEKFAATQGAASEIQSSEDVVSTQNSTPKIAPQENKFAAISPELSAYAASISTTKMDTENEMNF